MINYREPLFRPPAEADSLIFQAAYGCPHNCCRFCMMYKSVRYSVRDKHELFADFEEGARLYPDASRIFLADGDVMVLPFGMLCEYLERLGSLFPQLARVNVYANGSSILDKTEEQLRELHRLKLNTVYVGLESGDEGLLKLVNKGETAGNMVRAVKTAQACGLRCSVMALAGLGGRGHSEIHALKTAEVLNNMQPRLLSVLRFIEVPGTVMFKGYEAVSEYEAVLEIRKLIENLDLEKTVFRANHASNPVPLGGRFPQDKGKLIAELDYMLASRKLDRKGPGPVPFYL
ncbi:MAG: hypothetical protein A2017_15235 [Lentisphaerae bacterium GWF2_44_16]|nr:MAG: hypothetical protein A2017_15235 [Lentisphaerae bacterium GWF2_44_16]